MDEKDQDVGPFDPSIPEEGPSVPPAGWLDSVTGYEDHKGGDCTDQIYPPPPDFIPEPENDRNASIPNVMMPQVSEDVAREALIKFVGKKWTYSRKPAQNLVFKDLRPFTVYRYRLETFTESRSSAWEHELYTGQYVDGPQYGSIPPPWQVEVQYPPKFTDTVQKVRVPHTSSVKSCHQCQGTGRVRCIHCHSRGWISCMSCHGAIHGRNRKCVGCHGRGRKVKNQVYEFIPDRLPEFPIKKFEKVSGEAFFIDESLLVYPIVGFPDKEICNASEEAIHEHLNKYSAVSRILQQRQSVELVPLTQAFYTYNGKHYDYFVYGTEKKVHTTKYPTSCTVL
ncbi:protein SSUH2 homolog isoform X2 [Ictalurus furcatus]|uniref:protein SSUH2 homolog isoform X2 n=1 Tax=Ictalurus furcatus TaxID=66913 RepID=UPI002350721F|nr:protein SSUH2 homolog isoform X2 [Ictalurus furcatus]